MPRAALRSTISAANIGVNGNDQSGNGGGFTPITVDGGSTLNLTGNLSGVSYVSWGGISKYGTGTLVLTGNSGIAQGMWLAGGTVEFSANSLPFNLGGYGAPAGYAADFEGNATLQWAPGNTQDISGNGGNSGYSTQQIKIADGVTATFDTNGNKVTLGTAFALGPNGTGAVVKAGSGTLMLTAANTYTGGTIINGGTLKLQGGAFSTTAGSYSIAPGAVLNLDGNTGVALGTTTIAGNGTLRITNGQLFNTIGLGRNISMELGSGACDRCAVRSDHVQRRLAEHNLDQ